jgi:peptide/nickel transport system permease protein
MNTSCVSPWKEAWRHLWRRPLIRFCLFVMAVFFVLALYGEGVYRYYHMIDQVPPYQKTDLRLRCMPPTPAVILPETAEQHEPAWRFPWLGTDNLGRDVLQRIIQGARIAFHVGIMTSLIAIPLGVVLGCLSGYYGGRVDALIVWLYSTVASIPGILFVLAVAMLVGKGLVGIYLGIGLTTWVGVCRLIRAEVLKHKDRPYVQAARVLGFSNFRILFRHILPNVAHVILIVFSIRFPAAVGTEVFLSFLGVGVQHEPSWGVMINNARLRLWQGVWWEMTFVTLAIFLLVLSFNLVGDALRDAFDPRLRTAA